MTDPSPPKPWTLSELNQLLLQKGPMTKPQLDDYLKQFDMVPRPFNYFPDDHRMQTVCVPKQQQQDDDDDDRLKRWIDLRDDLMLVDSRDQIYGPVETPHCTLRRWDFGSATELLQSPIGNCLGMFNYIPPIYFVKRDDGGYSVFMLVDHRRRRPPMGKTW